MTGRRLTADQLHDLAGVLGQTRPDEITCDEWLDRIAGYTDCRLAGPPPPDGAALIEHHLAICPECKEEFEALLAALRG